MDKSLILNRISEHYNLSNQAALARFLGVSPQTLANWRARNTIDLDVLLTKCEAIDFNWLLFGRGESSTSQAEATIIYKSDPKDTAIIELQAKYITKLEDQVADLKKAKPTINPPSSSNIPPVAPAPRAATETPKIPLSESKQTPPTHA